MQYMLVSLVLGLAFVERGAGWSIDLRQMLDLGLYDIAKKLIRGNAVGVLLLFTLIIVETILTKSRRRKIRELREFVTKLKADFYDILRRSGVSISFPKFSGERILIEKPTKNDFNRFIEEKLESFNDEERASYRNQERKSYVAYFYLLVAGILGGHRFYLGRWLSASLYVVLVATTYIAWFEWFALIDIPSFWNASAVIITWTILFLLTPSIGALVIDARNLSRQVAEVNLFIAEQIERKRTTRATGKYAEEEVPPRPEAGPSPENPVPVVNPPEPEPQQEEKSS